MATSVQECKMKYYKRDPEEKHSEAQQSSLKTSGSGLCCVCHTIPQHSRTYYGRLFCTNCFLKYIWSPAKKDFTGDLNVTSDDEIESDK